MGPTSINASSLQVPLLISVLLGLLETSSSFPLSLYEAPPQCIVHEKLTEVGSLHLGFKTVKARISETCWRKAVPHGRVLHFLSWWKRKQARRMRSSIHESHSTQQGISSSVHMHDKHPTAKKKDDFKEKIEKFKEKILEKNKNHVIWFHKRIYVHIFSHFIFQKEKAAAHQPSLIILCKYWLWLCSYFFRVLGKLKASISPSSCSQATKAVTNLLSIPKVSLQANILPPKSASPGAKSIVFLTAQSSIQNGWWLQA